jgi:uncharacterized protein YnzC (UPF0291/DUF896 family)
MAASRRYKEECIVQTFTEVQGPKLYRKAYLENVKKSLERVDVEWNTPILEWGTNLTGLNQS